MKFKSLILLILFFGCNGASFAIQKINAGISVDYIKDVNESIIYNAPSASFIPKINYSDLGYFVKFKPQYMLSHAESAVKNHSKRTVILNGTYEAPSVYNISMQNGGSLDYSKAPESIEELVLKNPKRPEYLYAYAIKLSEEKKYTESLSVIDKALEINNNYALGHFLKGDILRTLGCYKDAAREYYATIQLNPYCTDAYFNIAKMLETTGSIDLAISFYEMAYTVNPDDLEIRNQILKLNRKRAA